MLAALVAAMWLLRAPSMRVENQDFDNMEVDSDTSMQMHEDRASTTDPPVSGRGESPDGYLIQPLLQTNIFNTKPLGKGHRGMVFEAEPYGVHGVLKMASKKLFDTKANVSNIKYGNVTWEAVVEGMEREAKTLKHLRQTGADHPCVVSGLDQYYDRKNEVYYILMSLMKRRTTSSNEPTPSAAVLHQAFAFLETMNWLYTNNVITHDKATQNFMPQPNFACQAFIDMDCDLCGRLPSSTEIQQLHDRDPTAEPFGDCSKHKSALDDCFKSRSGLPKDLSSGLPKDHHLLTSSYTKYHNQQSGAGLLVGKFNWGKRVESQKLATPNYLYKTEDELALAYLIIRDLWLALPDRDAADNEPWRETFDEFHEYWQPATLPLERGAFRPRFWEILRRLKGY